MALSPPDLLQLRRRFSLHQLSATHLDTQGATAGIQSKNLNFEDAKEQINKMLEKVELSISAYDTAWVAMVSSPASPSSPCFPGSINWVLENQLHDGSWGLADRHPLLTKDALSSTFACVLALKKWHLGEEQMAKGLDFIRSNFSLAMDEKQHSPIGFEVIFPSMIQSAIQMGINLHVTQNDIDAMLSKKDLELMRISGMNSMERSFYSGYISEGMGHLQDWGMVMKHQRKNGSLYNSPSATAACLSHFQNSGCHSYLSCVLEQFGNGVPTVYPYNTHTRLSLVDSLEKLGIGRHFGENIRSILDETYRKWMQGDEEIFADISTCAMAFRLLRMQGYDVSSESLAICDENNNFAHYGGHMKDVGDALELFRASQIMLYPNELSLEKHNLFSRQFLEQKVKSHFVEADGFTKQSIQEVEDALKRPYHASLERLSCRKSMELYNLNKIKALKSSFCNENFCPELILKLAAEDFNSCQLIHQQEYKELKRWVVDSRLDQLGFARQKLGYCYFSAAATLFPPELADARMSWAKNGVLTTVVDDFFDVGSSEEEQVNLIQLVEKWDVNEDADYCSEKVKIIYSALHSTISDIGDRAYAWQGRSVTSHIVEIWLCLIKSMFREAEMSRNKSVPTMEEYMENAYISFALGPIVLPALYSVGPKLSEKGVRSDEYHKLFKLMSTCGRLLNDVRGFRREGLEGKLNAVSLLKHHSKEALSEEEAMLELKLIADRKRRELLRLVVEEKDSMVPRACKDLFWKMTRVLHLFYIKDDGFTSKDMESLVKLVLQEPVII